MPFFLDVVLKRVPTELDVLIGHWALTDSDDFKGRKNRAVTPHFKNRDLERETLDSMPSSDEL